MIFVGKAKAVAEWGQLRRVVVRRPGIEALFGLLEPFSALYERVFSLERAVREHDDLVKTLRRDFGVNVEYLDEIIMEAAGRSHDVYEELAQWTTQALQFTGYGAGRARRHFLENLPLLERDVLLQILVLAPSINFVKRKGTRSIMPFTTLRVPLTNLFFMRDQQAVGDRGIILSRMAKPQRRRETELTSFAWRAIGEKPVAAVRTGTFEGGDFLPCGSFALIGTGDRTSPAAVREILTQGVGYPEVAVVHQPRHPLLRTNDPMVNMHLDTYLNFPGEGLAVGYPDMLSSARTDVYRKAEEGKYHLSRRTRLSHYLTGQGFTIIPITTLEQMCYATNFLTIRDRNIVVPDVASNAEKVLANLKRAEDANPWKYHDLFTQASMDYSELRSSGTFFPNKPLARDHGVKAEKIRLSNITGAFGGAHCLTATLERA